MPTRATTRNQQKVHVYAGISFHGITPLFFVEGTSGAVDIGTSVTASSYTALLENCLLPAFHSIMDSKERHPVFQQDGAPAHTASLTTTYLSNQDIIVLSPWPAYSPDLSPIENGWAILQNEMNKLRITSFEDFKLKLQSTWLNCMRVEVCEELINSMPRRLEAVVNMGGGATKY